MPSRGHKRKGKTGNRRQERNQSRGLAEAPRHPTDADHALHPGQAFWEGLTSETLKHPSGQNALGTADLFLCAGTPRWTTLRLRSNAGRAGRSATFEAIPQGVRNLSPKWRAVLLEDLDVVLVADFVAGVHLEQYRHWSLLSFLLPQW